MTRTDSSGGTAPRLAIIIPHFRDPARLRRALAALAPQLLGRDDVELVVVDNGATLTVADLGDLPAGLPALRLVWEAQPGAAPARNRGVQESRAEVLGFVDCDCVPAEDWVTRACALGAELCQAPGVIGGAVRVFDEPTGARAVRATETRPKTRPKTRPETRTETRTGAQAFETVFAFDNRDYVERKGFSVTANLLTTRSVFAATGEMRRGLSEDLDWCQRAVARGYRLRYAADLEVAHPTRSDWAALAGKWRRLTAESFGLRRRSVAADLGWGIRALAMGPSVLVHLPRIWRHEALSAGEKWRASGVLLRLRLARGVWMWAQLLGRFQP